MCAPGNHVSMYEVWKEWQVHEDSRKVYGAEVFVNNFCGTWRKKYLGSHDLVSKSGYARRNIDLVQEMLRPCEAENGTKISELL